MATNCCLTSAAAHAASLTSPAAPLRLPAAAPPQTPDMVDGLTWNAQQSPAWAILTLDPDFEDYVRQSFSFEPRSGLFGIMLAIHVCRSVEIYGFGQSEPQGEAGREGIRQGGSSWQLPDDVAG